MSGNATNTARRVACPTCHVPRFEYCVNPDGAIAERSHPARVAAARGAPDITPAQVATLHKLHLDPTRYIEPIVRKTLLARGLIVSLDPPTAPSPYRRAKRPRRRHPLTDAGRAVLGVTTEPAAAEVKAS